MLNTKVEEIRKRGKTGCKLTTYSGTVTKKLFKKIIGSYINGKELTIVGWEIDCKDLYIQEPAVLLTLL